MLLLRDRVGVVAALNIILPKMLCRCLELWMHISLLLVENALELRLFHGRLGHERLPICRLRPFLKQLSAMTLEIGIALRISRVIAIIRWNCIRFRLPVILTILA